MNLLLGFSIVFIAGIIQGTFMLPMTLTKKWNWENNWFGFSLFGMLLINWILALIFVPHIFSVFKMVPVGDILKLVLFGLGWGIGAILFGIGMDKLGMSLGYPIIQSMVAVLGGLIPVLIFNLNEVITLRGGILLFGAIVNIIGVIVCSRAYALKEGAKSEQTSHTSIGVIIAVGAGLLCCLPNVGASYGESTIKAATQFGASVAVAGNAVWAIFFTVGFIPNALYTFYLMRRNNSRKYFSYDFLKNLSFILFMALMWIGSMYLYGTGASKLGDWGLIIGWPLFISLSIIVGNLWGLFRGEWRNATLEARKTLNTGLIIILLAIILIGVCNVFK